MARRRSRRSANSSGRVSRLPSDNDKNTILVHAIAPALWEDIPALVVPTPRLMFRQDGAPTDLRMTPLLSYAVVVLDREYMMGEMLSALAQQHFRGTGDGFDYQLAVVSATGHGIVYHTAPDFSPAPDAKADASIDLFQVRVQEFGALAAEVRRFATFTTTVQGPAQRGSQDWAARVDAGLARGA